MRRMVSKIDTGTQPSLANFTCAQVYPRKQGLEQKFFGSTTFINQKSVLFKNIAKTLAFRLQNYHKTRKNTLKPLLHCCSGFQIELLKKFEVVIKSF